MEKVFGLKLLSRLVIKQENTKAFGRYNSDLQCGDFKALRPDVEAEVDGHYIALSPLNWEEPFIMK